MKKESANLGGYTQQKILFWKCTCLDFKTSYTCNHVKKLVENEMKEKLNIKDEE